MRIGRRIRRGIAVAALAAACFALSFPWVLRLFYPIPYRQEVERAALEAGLDPFLLVAMMRVESRFNPNAESSKGARGLMQVMPETGAWVAVQMGMARFHPDLLFDPAVNVKIGAWYFAHLQTRFDGRRVPALAAYNGGQGNVKKWLDTSRWDGAAETLHHIPFAETRAYVQKVLTTYHRYRKAYEGRWETSRAAGDPWDVPRAFPPSAVPVP